MLVFDVRCKVLEPIHITEATGNDVTIAPGQYRLQGIEHLVKNTAGGVGTTGTDITFVAEGDGKAAYVVSAESLAHFIAGDEVEVQV